MVIGFGKVFALGEAFLGGGGGSDWSSDGEAFGVGDWRLAFLLAVPEVLSLPLAPKSPVSVLGACVAVAFAFALRLGGLVVDVGCMPRSLSPVGVPLGVTGWAFGSAASPVCPGKEFV